MRQKTVIARCLIAGLMVWLLLPGRAQAGSTVSVDPGTTWGTWEGWGASLCWWASVFGTRDDLADIVFTTNYTTLNGTSLPGLGLNIARYNAGACSTNTIGTEAMVVSPNMIPFRQMAGFWRDWSSTNPSSASWDWTVDANQRAMLQKARARGVNLLELFSNSPLWWMCKNHNPSGGDSGGDNLQTWNRQNHALYLATIAQYARDRWGITFNSVAAFNEPSATWWTASGTQEGCHLDTSTQEAVIGFLRTELDNRGLSTVAITASDESYFDQALTTWNSFSTATRARVDQVNVHGYQGSGGNRAGLYAATAGKRVWNTEHGESDGTGMTLARDLNLDFHALHPTAWCYWQPFDSGGWGLVQSNPGDLWIGQPNPKYHVLAQYSRHLRPGMTLLEDGDANTITAYDATARRLVIVTVNYATPQSVSYDLSAFRYVEGPISRWVTVTGSGDKYRAYQDTALNGKSFTAAFASNSVQTFEIQGVGNITPQWLVPTGSVWRFNDSGANLGTAWRNPGYNDTAWRSGRGQFGFGDGDEVTLVASNRQFTTYFRRTFNAATHYTNLTLRLLRDDGAVVYLNGVEIFRSNIRPGLVDYLTAATNALALDETSTFYVTNVSPALLLAGPNVLAVEVHQNSATSSDLSFELNLSGEAPPVSATLVSPGSLWRYVDATNNLGTAWRETTFNDTPWRSGPAQLGFGDGDEATVTASNRQITTYFRTSFFVPDATQVFDLTAHLLRDDGAVVYLNGTEVWRDNLPSGTVGYATLAIAGISGAAESDWHTQPISPNPLVTGVNVLAVEVHQNTNTSSDVSFDFALTATAMVRYAPALSAQATPGVRTLSWPGDAGYLKLFGATNLAQPVWQETTNTPFWLNNQWNVALPIGSDRQRFFQLRSP
jgi:galactan endo-1,6-beta-galactosidase